MHLKESPMRMITTDELELGAAAFDAHEARDSMYRVATFLVEHFWGKPKDMADGLGVLLLTWNQAFYRYGPFDFEALERFLVKNMPTISGFRRRQISTFQPTDEPEILTLFGELLDALRIRDKGPSAPTSPVAASKALHLLAPSFFPLWDQEIAKAYGCSYSSQPAVKYIKFMKIMKSITSGFEPHLLDGHPGRSILKLIDQYNYSKYTKAWV